MSPHDIFKIGDHEFPVMVLPSMPKSMFALDLLRHKGLPAGDLSAITTLLGDDNRGKSNFCQSEMLRREEDKRLQRLFIAASGSKSDTAFEMMKYEIHKMALSSNPTGRINALKFNPVPGGPLPIPGTKAYEDHKSRVKRLSTAIDFSAIEARIMAMQTYGVLFGKDTYDVDGTDISHKNLDGDDYLEHLYFINAVKSVQEYHNERTAVGLFIEQFELEDGTTIYACDFTDRFHMFDDYEDEETGRTEIDEYIKCDFDFRQHCFDLGIKVEPSPIGKYGKSYEWQ